MSVVLNTPWTDDEIDALARYQLRSGVEHYLCGNPDHGDEKPRMLPTRGGWTCVASVKYPGLEECFYIRQWAYLSSLTMVV